MGASVARRHVSLHQYAFLGNVVSVRSAIADRAIRHRTRIGWGRRGLTLDHQGNLSPPHVYVMFVAEWAQFLTSLHNRHMASTEFATPSGRVTEGMGFVSNESGITFWDMPVKRYLPTPIAVGFRGVDAGGQSGVPLSIDCCQQPDRDQAVCL